MAGPLRPRLPGPATACDGHVPPEVGGVEYLISAHGTPAPAGPENTRWIAEHLAPASPEAAAALGQAAKVWRRGVLA
jgi:hypothetical protein